MVTNEIYLDIFTLAWTMGDSYDFDLLVPEGCSWVVEWGDGRVNNGQGDGKWQRLVHKYPFRNMDIVFMFMRKPAPTYWDSMRPVTR